MDACAGGILTIYFGVIAANWRRLSARAPSSECAAVVKANAYGTGIETTVPALAGAGCKTFFVAVPHEGERVRRIAPNATIYVLSGLMPGIAPFLAQHRLRPVLGSAEEISEWAAFVGAHQVDGHAAVH